MSGLQGRGILSGDHSKANFGFLLSIKRLSECTRMSWGVKSFLIKKVLNGAPDFHKKRLPVSLRARDTFNLSRRSRDIRGRAHIT